MSIMSTLAEGYRLLSARAESTPATVVDFPHPVAPTIALCRVTSAFRSIRAGIESAADKWPILTYRASSGLLYMDPRSSFVTKCARSPTVGYCEIPPPKLLVRPDLAYQLYANPPVVGRCLLQQSRRCRASAHLRDDPIEIDKSHWEPGQTLRLGQRDSSRHQ